MIWKSPIKKGIKKIIIEEKNIFKDKLIVNFEINSFNKKIIKPIEIAINKTLKKFSFLWNFAVKPTITNAMITTKIGFNISER